MHLPNSGNGSQQSPSCSNAAEPEHQLQHYKRTRAGRRAEQEAENRELGSKDKSRKIEVQNRSSCRRKTRRRGGAGMGHHCLCCWVAGISEYDTVCSCCCLWFSWVPPCDHRHVQRRQWEEYQQSWSSDSRWCRCNSLQLGVELATGASGWPSCF